MGNLFFSEDMVVDELDNFLFKELGYDNISALTPGLFLDPLFDQHRFENILQTVLMNILMVIDTI